MMFRDFILLTGGDKQRKHMSWDFKPAEAVPSKVWQRLNNSLASIVALLPPERHHGPPHLQRYPKQVLSFLRKKRAA